MRAAGLPLALAGLALLPLALIDASTYLTLTVAGLAMGMLIFLVASGLTLIFGLMDVLNFAHGALSSWGAYAGFTVVILLNGAWGWADSPSVAANAALLLAAIAAAMAVALGLGMVLERVIVDFCDAIQEGRQPRVSGREALRVHRLVDALLLAAREGRRVTMTEAG